MNQKYDAIVEIGYRFEPNWELPQHLQDSLLITADLYKAHIAPLIIVAGKWSFGFDKERIIPPITEAEMMKRRLVSLGVVDEVIVKEEYSKDTVGNAYYVKTKVVKPRKLKSLLVVCAEFHGLRVQFVFKKVFGEEYKLDFKLAPTTYDSLVDEREKILLQKNMDFLSSMRDGDDEYLKGRLYSDPFYL